MGLNLESPQRLLWREWAHSLCTAQWGSTWTSDRQQMQVRPEYPSNGGMHGHSPHKRIHGHGDRRLCVSILWSQDSTEWVTTAFRSFSADVWPHPPGVQLSTLGWCFLTSTRKPKPAERKWNKMSEGEQNRGYYGHYVCPITVTHISTSTYWFSIFSLCFFVFLYTKPAALIKYWAK